MPNRARWLNAAFLSIVVAACACGPSAGSTSDSRPSNAPAAPSRPARWTPSLGDRFQSQLSGSPDRTIRASVYDLDVFETTAADVAALHAKGRHVVCYIDAGSFEKGRPDEHAFPAVVLGAIYVGYPDERWLDIRRLDLLAPIMDARLDLCKSKAFDAVEPDNIDGWQNTSGFPLSAKDQIAYNTWFARHAHARGLSIALKNDGDQTAQLLPWFDFAIVEDCWRQSLCQRYAAMVAAKKVVFTIEYSDRTSRAAFRRGVCPKARRAGMIAVMKNRTLDAWRDACP